MSPDTLRNLGGDALDAARVDAARRVLHDLQLGTTCHLKGFSAGMRSEDLEEVAAKLIRWVREKGMQTIVWDGDDLESDSFTFCIPRLMAEASGVKFLAFLRHCEQGTRYTHTLGFRGSWQAVDSANTTVVLVRAARHSAPRSYLAAHSPHRATPPALRMLCEGGRPGRRARPL